MRLFSSAAVALALGVVAGCGTAVTSAPQNTTGTRLAASDVSPVAQKSHLYSTLDILGIGPVYAQKFQAMGIKRALDLLETGHTRNGRNTLAQNTGISPKLILTWVNHADLIRVTGAGPVYARMLEDAGVDTVAELAARNPVNLRDSLERVRVKGGKTMVERMPSSQTVADWVNSARNLGRYVEY